jgi:molybdopterin/thiamine biosynthesis adenylyltransferase
MAYVYWDHPFAAMSHDELTPHEWTRYARQIGPGVLTPQGQVRLRRATVLVSRIGGVGGAAALALVSAGVGRLIFAHGGSLEWPDLNRQVLGSESGVEQPRAAQFAERLRAMNHDVEVEAVDHEPDDAEALALARRSTMVLSCAPTFEERLRLNRVALAAGVPLIDAAQWGLSASLIAVDPGRTACLECVYPEPPPFEPSFPVLGAIAMASGALAAMEAVKIVAGVGRAAFGRMWVIDGHQGRTSIVELARRPDCPACGALLPKACSS